MKPEKGSEDMEEVSWDPTEMCVDVGMLVTEARTPDNSPKGRVEGPHVPPITGALPHKCDKHREQCRKADLLRKQILFLCRNDIPMRIDILLLPNCEHGQREAAMAEGTSMPSMDDVLLLERWDVQIIQKRSDKTETVSVTGRFLLQAIRSYLHFSQLSSWLNSSRGYLPLQIIYRIYAPGENVSQTFSSTPDVHHFPQADLHNALMRVYVTSIPRQQYIPHLKCREEMQFFNKVPAWRKIVQDKEGPNCKTEGPNCKLDKGLLQEPKSWSKKTEELRRKSPELFIDTSKQSQDQSHSHGAIPKKTRSHMQKSQNIDTDSSSTYHKWQKPPIPRPVKEQSPEFIPGISDIHIPKYSSVFPHNATKQCQQETLFSFHKPPREKLPMVSQMFTEFKPLELSGPIDPKCLSMRLPSPKVLMTQTASGTQSYYKKRELDLNTPPVEQNVEERLMTGNIADLVKPLNSEDLESYLSSLTHPYKDKSALTTDLKNIPTTKCKFYIGDSDPISPTNSSQKTISPPNLSLKTIDHNPDLQDEQNKSNSSLSNQKTSEEEIAFKNRKDQNIPARCIFKKSLSEPGLSVDKLSLCQLSTSPDEKLCDLDSSLAKSFQDLPFFELESSENGCSSDSSSTPTNSLSERNGAMSKYFTQNSSKSHDKVHSREATPTCELLSSKLPSSNSDLISHTNSDQISSSLSSHKKFSKDATNGLPVSTNGVTSDDANAKHDGKGLSLCKQLLRKELQKNINDTQSKVKGKIPECEEIRNFQESLNRSTAMMFNTSTGLPSRSSPAPIKRKSSKRFDYDDTLINARAIKNALSCSKLTLQSELRTSSEDTNKDEKVLSASAPASTNCLLGNFEESVLNGRIEPVGVVEGFTCEIGAGGSFCPKHLNLPVTAYFFQLSDDNAPSPYLGHINLEPLGKKGYRVPSCGTVQVTLFNPNKTVVKMFVVMYDLSDMPANCQTFLRQRTVYMPVDLNSCEPSYLRYLIHLRFSTTKSSKLYLHTDIRLIFARDKFEFDPSVAKYELRSFTEGPQNPKFSPKR